MPALSFLPRPALIALLPLLFLPLTPAAAQVATAPPVEAFFANPTLDQVRLSPSGRYLAALSAAPGRRDVLAVVDLETDSIKIVAGYAGFDVLQFAWVNDDRLMYNVGDSRTAPGERYQAPGLFAVNRDGSKARQLAARDAEEGVVATTGSRLETKLLPWHTFMLGQRGAENSDYAYVASVEYARGEVQAVDLLHLNTVTGQFKTVPRPALVKHWLLDNGGEPRLAVSADGNQRTLHYRDPASGEWRTIASQARFVADADSFWPVGFGADGTLYVETRAGKDTSALYPFDLATGRPGKQSLIEARGYDFDGELVSHRGKLLGATLRTDADGNVWLDPAMAAMQQKIDKLLPGKVNMLSVPSRPDSPWVLVESFSDAAPTSFILYNKQTGALNRVGNTHPAIDPARMGRQRPVRYKARDGREIPGLLTMPPGATAKLPLVVLVHGGPYVRGSSWGWNPEAQFLASRGYAVLEPEFRGTTGYGAAHFEAGWKQWGLAMQDDLADGVQWAVSEGIADPGRVCIAGASYGGYAALMGLVKDGKLYQCAVSWVGVTDINLLYNGRWNFASGTGDDFKAYGMPVLIGDPEKDAAQLKATSPIAQAARIDKPLLLAYGGNDRRVPVFHGDLMRDAVRKHNRQVEYVVYPDEGHGWSKPETRFDFWMRVEKFLARHIGGGPAQ